MNNTSYFFLSLFTMVSCAGIPEPSPEVPPMLLPPKRTPFVNTPVLFGRTITEDKITNQEIPENSNYPHLIKVILQFTKLPPEEEGRSFTLLGGGLNNKGLHGPNFSQFKGRGYHFARTVLESSANPLRDEGYEKDYTRQVSQGSLEFTVFYSPSEITQWGERYRPGSQLALTLMRQGTTDRVLWAKNNQFNWSWGGLTVGSTYLISLEY